MKAWVIIGYGGPFSEVKEAFKVLEDGISNGKILIKVKE